MKFYVLSGIMCASLVFATATYSEILGGEPGTSSNPKDNVPKDIQGARRGEARLGPGVAGPVRGRVSRHEEREIGTHDIGGSQEGR